MQMLVQARAQSQAPSILPPKDADRLVLLFWLSCTWGKNLRSRMFIQNIEAGTRDGLPPRTQWSSRSLARDPHWPEGVLGRCPPILSGAVPVQGKTVRFPGAPQRPRPAAQP